MKKYRIVITGIVQGVGFRPFIYNLAMQHKLKGWVGNSDSNVIIEVEANYDQLTGFIQQIRRKAPTLSKIESIKYEELPFESFEDFTIKESQTSSKGNIFISPDVATCSDCLEELKDKNNIRYMYPFINCTNCGPRFTIIKDIPYDRDKTTMNTFEMCDNCRQEYTSPTDRRYHAQPVACHDCGPSLDIVLSKSASKDDQQKLILNQQHNKIQWNMPEVLRKNNTSFDSYMNSIKCIEYIAQIIKNGQIAAIKGIGGYHLVCDALNDSAVERLRTRKHRDKKPFALMMKNLDVIAKYCKMNEKEIELLKSPASPIVLLERNEGIKLPALIAPLNRYLGVMLPYTPIHHILFEQHGFPEIIVMTSGNLSSEPIFYSDDAINALSDIADAFLTNNRDIYIRTDDSVTRVFDNKEYIIRRSRGYVPKPIILDVYKLLDIDENFEIPSVLACGGELKNVFCLNKNNLFYLSHHIGDLENESTNNAFTSGIEHFEKLFDISPDYIAHDLHPNYFSSLYAINQTQKNKIGIQHHEAHIASCMAENQLSGEVIGVSFDGTGFGEDGTIWGGEFFKGGYYGFERAGHLDYVMMPGGDSAVKHPWRMAVSYLFSTGKINLVQESLELGCIDNINEKTKINVNDTTKADVNISAETSPHKHINGALCSNTEQIITRNGRLLANINQKDIDFTIKMLEKQLNCPQTSSMGRLFDAVSALIGINTDISYEGQAAIELEYYAVEENSEPYAISFYSKKTDGELNEINLYNKNVVSAVVNNSDSPNRSGNLERLSNSDCSNGSDSSDSPKATVSIDEHRTGFIIQTSFIINQIIQDIQYGKSKEHIATRFHSTIAEIVLQGCSLIRKSSGLSSVVLSGGVFQNLTLLKMSVNRLREHGFNVYTHSEIPANDGGISIGQAMLALAQSCKRYRKLNI